MELHLHAPTTSSIKERNNIAIADSAADAQQITVRKKRKAGFNNPIALSFLVLLSVIAAVFYLGLITNQAYRGSLLPYVFVVVAEVFIVFQILMSSWTILSGGEDPRDPHFYETQLAIFSKSGNQLIRPQQLEQTQASQLPFYLNGNEAKIDVVITVYGEDTNVIRQTALAAQNITGKHNTFILDDGGSDEIKDFAATERIGYIRRVGSDGAKAGNINHALRYLTGDYLVVLDADFTPEPQFLYETMPFFNDDQLAFVQTPQFYKNKHNHIAKGASYAQDLFYKYICPGKNKFNAAFCVGTNVVFRRKALDEIGGIYQKSKSEDIWTSLLLHEKGWNSIFTPSILAKGEAPDTVKAYVKQQQRWATGGMEILFHRNPLFIKGLTFNQKLQYFWTASFYLNGLAIALLFFLPAIYLVLGLSPINGELNVQTWFFLYSAFYGLQVLIATYCMRGFRSETLVLATVSFPIYLKALANGLLMRDEKWHVTGSTKKDSPYNYIVIQLVLFALLIITDVIGIVHFYNTSELSVAFAWNLVNTYVFWYFIKIAHSEYKQEKRRLVA